MNEQRLAHPNALQLAWQDMELSMFIHFGPNTWQENAGWDDLSTPLDRINPTKLDTDQWVRVAQSFGAGQIIFTAKHVGGFACWQTQTTPYGLKETPWRGGKGDIMRDLSESCRKYGIKLGVYLSPQDGWFKAGIGGQCANAADQEHYKTVYREQLTELLSRYGEMSEVWFDGGMVFEVGDLLKCHAPNAIVFQGPDTHLRWVGSELGFAPYPAWNSVASRSSGARDGRPDGAVWLPLEVDTTLHLPTEWFWRANTAGQIRTVEQLMDVYYKSVGRGAGLLLNAAPDTTGRIPDCDERRFAEFGAEIRRRFGQSLAGTSGAGETVELRLAAKTAVDHVIAMEEIAEGERVHEYEIEGLTGGGWRTLCRGISIGHKRIDAFDPVEVSALRLRVLKCAARPLIRRLAAYRTGVVPPHVRTIETPASAIKIGEWDPAEMEDLVKKEYNLTPFCKEARLYEVEFVETPSHDYPYTVRAKLLVDGIEAKGGIVGSLDRANQFHINLTGVGRSIVLRVEMYLMYRGGMGATTKGDVRLTPR